MKVNIYCVRDAKAEAFMQHQCFPTKGVAIRAFTEAVNTPDSPFNKNPEDYAMFELGSFDDSNGMFELNPQPVCVIQGFEVLKRE